MKIISAKCNLALVFMRFRSIHFLEKNKRCCKRGKLSIKNDIWTRHGSHSNKKRCLHLKIPSEIRCFEMRKLALRWWHEKMDKWLEVFSSTWRFCLISACKTTKKVFFTRVFKIKCWCDFCCSNFGSWFYQKNMTKMTKNLFFCVFVY